MASTMSHSLAFAALLACLATSSAFSVGPSLLPRAGAATGAARVLRRAVSPLRMEAAAPAEKIPVGLKAAEFSKAIAHPKPVAVDADIRKVLPHRYPFLLVDKILDYEPGVMAVGVKCITANEPQFTGHFPDRPIMPGVLQIEAMAQVGGYVALQPPMAEPGQDFFFGGVDNVKWRKPLVPGDVLVMEMRVTTFKKKFGICKMQGKGYVDGQVAVEGDFTFALART
mmetsp:Transcript_18918/g.46441  ORF Transcript_18918/g.46441 Transcript_18918/m.46441 type:complete len:226 (+) Transcript_18918:3-680(+)